MKQFIQSVQNGKISVEAVPPPVLQPQGIRVRTAVSLISAGTERAVLKLSQKNILGKAKARPDLVRKVLDKARRDGFMATFQTVREKLDREAPLGYSVCGRVLDVGDRAREFQVGQTVACAGAGYANHAEINYIPRLLACAVPDGVAPEAAAYSTVGTIAMQGIRNMKAEMGETVVVLGLGLIGQLTVQLLKAAGCRVVALDLAADRVELAAANGAELATVIDKDETPREVLAFTRGRGADGVLITAATTSNEPVELAGELARSRARVVQVGMTGRNLPHKPYFEKELRFIVSRSYGPGRYDPKYEEGGHDYPVGYVRWTENRNMEAFLDMVASGAVRPEVLTTHRFTIDEAEKAFELVLEGQEPYLGIMLTYPEDSATEADVMASRISLPSANRAKSTDTARISFIGAGNFAQAVLLPNLKKIDHARLQGIVTSTGLTARSVGKKFGFDYCASTIDETLNDEKTDALFVVTRHSQHAEVVCRALAAGKAVFVEKPLAISLEQLRCVRQTLQTDNPGLMVGFNRRFAPFAQELKSHVAGRGPLVVNYRCNAGQLSEEHWTAAAEEGGRIIGEACHFFDFFAFLTDAAPVAVHAACPGQQTSANDASVTVTYADGSVCHLLYTSFGPASFSKERIEVYAGGAVGVLEDFRRLHLEQTGGVRKRRRALVADKGHEAEVKAFVDAVRSGSDMPIAADSLIDTTLTALAAVQSVQRRQLVTLAELREETVAEES